MSNLAEKLDRLGIGGNNPPEPTPFEQSQEEINDLYGEAKNWLDGAGINSQADADNIGKLIDMLRAAVKRADERRMAEAEPYRQELLKVQARYGYLIADNKSQKGKAIIALEVCKQALTPWLAKLDAEKRAAAEAARIEAEAKAAEAKAAWREAKFDDLASREKAEALSKEAAAAETAASRAMKDKAHAHGGSRAIGLRTSYRAEITDAKAFARYVWEHHYVELMGFLLTTAQQLIDAKRRNIPGVTIHEDKRV